MQCVASKGASNIPFHPGIAANTAPQHLRLCQQQLLDGSFAEPGLPVIITGCSSLIPIRCWLVHFICCVVPCEKQFRTCLKIACPRYSICTLWSVPHFGYLTANAKVLQSYVLYDHAPGALTNWAALWKWLDLEWWCHEYGHRSVPVELGRSGQPCWREEVMTIHSFVTRHLAAPSRAGIVVSP